MKIALLTDAWLPQVNGVVRTWEHVIEAAAPWGHRFEIIHPGLFKTFAAPKYPEIRLAVLPGRKMTGMLDALAPDAIHIATEGPIGQAGVRYCKRLGLPFTTSYHTQFPHYMHEYFRVPKSLTYRFLRWLHGSAEHVLVPTATVGKELEAQGFKNITVWCRGVDTDIFKTYEPKPGQAPLFADLPRPIFLNAGRVALEKNIEAFLQLELPGSKVVVGDGPLRERLQKQYPNVHWAGYQFGEDLARHYAAADVFVFPSRTDTFGIVMLEANAAGLPIAAYPVTGPIDVVQQGVTGVLDENLANACIAALQLNRNDCRQYALNNSWTKVAQQVIDTAAVIPRADNLPNIDTLAPVRI